jgi:hypothetical protein
VCDMHCVVRCVPCAMRPMCESSCVDCPVQSKLEMEVQGNTDLMTAFMHNGMVTTPNVRGCDAQMDGRGSAWVPPTGTLPAGTTPAGGDPGAGGVPPGVKPGGKKPPPKKVLTPEEQHKKDVQKSLKTLGDQVLEAGAWGPKMRAAGSPEALCASMEEALLPHLAALKAAHDRLTCLLASPAGPTVEDLAELNAASVAYGAVRTHAQKLAQKPAVPGAKGKAKARAKAPGADAADVTA